MGKWIGCLVVAALATSVVADDWYTWRGPTADGISKETGWNPKGASKAWTKELGAGYSTVSVKDGKLYTMGHKDGKDIVYCLDAKTGDKIWDYTYACNTGKFKGPRATPTYDAGNIYTVSREGQVFCFDAASGKKKWDVNVIEETDGENVRWGISTSAVIEGDLILLNIGEAGVALNKKSGKVAWASKGTVKSSKGKEVGAHSYATPVVFDRAGKRLAAIFSSPGLMIVEAETGKRVASYEWKTKYDINGADPLVIGDQIFISSGYDRECAMLDFSTGKLKKLWNSDVMKNQFSSAIHDNGYIYGVSGQTKKKGHLRCIAAKDGAEQWSMPIGFGSLMAADGKLIALGEKGMLYFAEITPEKYTALSKIDTGLGQLCWTPPVLANGIVYCRNDKGTLVAIDVSE